MAEQISGDNEWIKCLKSYMIVRHDPQVTEGTGYIEEGVCVKSMIKTDILKW